MYGSLPVESSLVARLEPIVEKKLLKCEAICSLSETFVSFILKNSGKDFLDLLELRMFFMTCQVILLSV